MQTKNVRLEELLGYLKQGQFIEAFHEFYAENVTMISPDQGTTTGFTENLEREQQFFTTVKEFRRFEVGPFVQTETHGFYQNIAAWLGNDGKEYFVDQVAFQKWENGKIVFERFYHDPI